MTLQGVVNSRLDAMLQVRVRGPSGAVAEVNGVIDTGYSGSLTLPGAVVESLGLERRSGIRVVLADGSSRRLDTFAADVEWGGAFRGVVASVLDTEVLIGMGLLVGHELIVEVVPGGQVEIRSIQGGDSS